MGIYLNPPMEDKTQWLLTHGSAIVRPGNLEEVYPDHLPVCLIDNGHYNAAAVAFNEKELDRLSRPDSRPKVWFSVPIEDIEKLLGVSLNLAR